MCMFARWALRSYTFTEYGYMARALASDVLTSGGHCVRVLCDASHEQARKAPAACPDKYFIFLSFRLINQC